MTIFIRILGVLQFIACFIFFTKMFGFMPDEQRFTFGCLAAGALFSGFLTIAFARIYKAANEYLKNQAM